MKNYKFASVQEWLFWANNNGFINSNWLVKLVNKYVDADDIQSTFEDVMQETGYFEEVDERFEP